MIQKSNANGPPGYCRKFRNFIKLCGLTRAGDVVIVATPHALGDNYEELIESLNRLDDAKAMLAIVPRSRREAAARRGPT